MITKTMSNKNRLTDSIIKWRVGIYCRLSNDDGAREESNSITNQKKLIENYINNEKNTIIVDYYIDDGVSGTSFNRPGFKKLYDDITNRKINAVIVKDLSRFGRNYVEMGRYIEETFQLYKIRFIAINDNIDSYKNPQALTDMIVPFKNLLNEEYARDISKKVRTSFRTMSAEGKWIGGTTPYGYTKNPLNKHQLIINESEANVVKLMYKKSIQGLGRIKLLRYLNENKVLCRKEVKRRLHNNISLDDKKEEIVYKWSGSTLENILSSEIYIGNLVWGRTGNLNYKNKAIIYKPREEWIVVENTHEAIISKSDFEKVKELHKERLKEHETNKDKFNRSIFAKKIVCGNCGRAMVKNEDYRKKVPYLFYSCRSKNFYDTECKYHSIKTLELNNAVIEAIIQQVKLVINLEKVLKKKSKNDNDKIIEKEFFKQVDLANGKIDNYKKEKKNYYEKLKFNKISKEEYILQAKKIDTEIEKLILNIDSLKKVYNENLKLQKTDDYWIEHFRRNKKVKELSKEVINELVEKIKIFPDNKVVVVFKYQNEYKRALSLMEDVGGEIND